MSHTLTTDFGTRSGFESGTHVNAAVRLIQIVDDDAKLGRALAAGLESAGFRTLTSTSVDAALADARREFPDLVLCDINMPGKSGLQLLEEVRHDPELANCPFVFMTGNPRYAEPRASMDLGADDFLLKPFTMEALVACVSARLRRSDISGHDEIALVKDLRAGLRRALPHEFFTPLTGIIGFAEMLQQEGDVMKPDECREALRSILHGGRRLHRTLRNYIYAVDRFSPDSAAPFPVLGAASVVLLIKQGALAAAERHERTGDLRLDLTGAELSGSAREISLLVEELTDNAFSFSRPGTPVEVQTRRAGAEMVITVADHGRGMTRQQLKALRLFRQFERSKYEQQGLGVGLFIVQQAVRRLGGRLQFESTKESGTTCQAFLPVAREGPPPEHGQPAVF
jgi:signal transduction histidine kinase